MYISVSLSRFYSLPLRFISVFSLYIFNLGGVFVYLLPRVLRFDSRLCTVPFVYFDFRLTRAL